MRLEANGIIGLLLCASLPYVQTGCHSSVSGFEAAREIELDPIAATDLARLDVRLPSGRIELRPSPDHRVHITARRYVRGATLEEAEDNLDRITLRAEVSAGDAPACVVTLDVPPELRNRSPGAHVVLELPPCAATLATSNGPVRVADWTGTLRIDTSNGAIHLANVEGDVHAKTSNGTIQLERVRGDVDVETDNGAIIARAVQGSCDLVTSNGRVDAELAPPPDGHVRVDTSNGAVTLTLPRALAAAFDCATSNAAITTDFHDVRIDTTDSGNASRKGRGRFAAIVNGGGCPVAVRTSNGAITLVME